MDFEINPDEVQRKLNAGEPMTIIDVREAVELQMASLNGAEFKHIPMGDVPSRAHAELDPDDHIVVICHHGVRSANVTMWLRNEGFERAQSMRGGIDLWSKTVDPSVPVY
jgi:rhodanese-related sulfurtransferase